MNKLHHFAYTIAPNNLEIVIELFNMLGCEISYREKDARWCILRQNSINVRIQMIEAEDEPDLTENKKNTHIAFLSDNPHQEIENIKKWAESKNIKFIEGNWSDLEFWFDLPDIFKNFVIEVMHTSVVE